MNSLIKHAFLSGYARALASRDFEDPKGSRFQEVYFDSPAANEAYEEWIRPDVVAFLEREKF